MRILHVAAPARVGGLEAVLQALAVGQREAGHDVRVAAVLDGSDGDGHPVADALAEARVPVTRLALPRRAYLGERAAVRDLCARLRPDVVHTHGYRADVVDAGVARRLGIPVVTTVHGFTGGGWKNRLYERLQQRAFRRFDAVVTVSRAQIDRLVAARVPRERLHLIPNASTTRVPFLDRGAARRALGVAPEGRHIGWVGRLSGEKGPDLMLAALARVHDLTCRLSVIGEGPLRQGLEREAARIGAAGRIAWHGEIPGAARLLRAFDVVVLSSRTEGTPAVLLEAMAAGIPVVVTAVGGVPDVVSPAEGLLAPPEDPAALAAAIDDVLRHPEAATVRVGAARARLEREFAPGPWVARYVTLYRTLATVGTVEAAQ